MQHISDPVTKLREAAYKVPSPPDNGRPSPASPAKHDLWHGFDAHCPKLQDAKRMLVDWYSNGLDDGQAIVLTGPYGTGKTHLALVVLGAYGAPRCPHGSLMISEPDMLANIKATYGGDGTEKMVMAQYSRVPLLILDDVGAAHVKTGSETWLEDIYWRILDRRSAWRLPLMLNTNLKLNGLADWIGGRAFSRLSGMMGDPPCHVDLFRVDDYRMRAWA